MRFKKLLNPETNKHWIKGDKRKDGAIFIGYQRNYISKEGYYKLGFATSNDAWIKINIKNTFRRKKNGKNKKTNLSLDYLLKIFPKNFICPVLKIRMSFGGKSDNSPSLDRINNNKGYIKGNVIWISFLANRIKQDASSQEILKVGRWLKLIEKK